MCIHDALNKIISKNDLDLFLEITNEFTERDFNACDNCCCSKDLKLYSLFESVTTNATEILKYLLQFDLANKENRYRETPLYVAVRNGHKETVELLLQAGANPNAENDNKETPLHLAARHGRKKIFIILYPKTDTKHYTVPSIFNFMRDMPVVYKQNMYNRIHSKFILQSHYFDTDSLFSNDYLPRDMVFLILKMAKKERRLIKYRLLAKQ